MRNKARTCEFENLQDSLIRDRIVCGIDDKNIRERLLRDNNLTLDRATAIVKASETSKSQVHELDGKNIDAIRKQNSHHKQNNYQNQTPMRKSPQIPKKSHPNNNITSAISNNFSKQTKSCYYCGTKHGRLCPAFGQQCSKCGKSNHFARVCQSSSFNANPQQIHEIEQQSNKFVFNPNYQQPFIPSANQLDINELFIDHVSNSNKTSSQNEILSKLDINGQFIEFKIDSGAQCNIIPIHIFNQIKNKPPIQNSNTILRTYGGNSIPLIGVCTMTVKFQHKTVNALFYIVNVNNAKPLMGLNSSQDLNIITINTVESDNKSKNNSILEQYDDIFKGLGKADGEYTIKLSENAKPTIHSPRKVPLTVLPKLKETLDRLENAGVITKLDHPTEWVNSLVIVKKKDGSLRLCLDPKDLNEYILRDFKTIPSPEEISCKLHDKEYFTVIDMRDCYWHIVLDSKSSELCTFNTPYGRYKFNRLPFGICVASDAAQTMVEKTFGDIPGVIVIHDDLIIASKTSDEHDKILTKVFERARERNIKFNKNKIQFKVSEVKYLGHIIGKTGTRPDPEKIDAIQEMPTPTNKQELQRFLGLVNYVGKFIPNLSQITTPLRNLLEKNSYWNWNHEHDAAIKTIKNIITTNPTLQFFGINKQAQIQVDASSLA